MGSPAQDMPFSQPQPGPPCQLRVSFHNFSVASSPPGQAGRAGLGEQMGAQRANASYGEVETQENGEGLIDGRAVQVGGSQGLDCAGKSRGVCDMCLFTDGVMGQNVTSWVELIF